MPIKAIIFDADGVLIPPWGFARHLEREYGITPAMMQGFFAGEFQRCLVGEADLRQVLPKHLSEWGWSGTLDDFLNAWFEAEKEIDSQLRDAIQALRAASITCCLATNQEHYRCQYMKSEMRLSSLFDHLFFSCELGVKKPAPAFYELIEQRLRLPGDAILYLDDSVACAEAAAALGWHAELYAGFETLQEKLALRGFVLS